MVRMICSQSPYDQFLYRPQSIRIQGNSTNSTLRLALLQMNLASHEINPPHLKVANLNAAHPSFVLQDGRVVGHGLTSSSGDRLRPTSDTGSGSGSYLLTCLDYFSQS
jgi:hypothetical protein